MRGDMVQRAKELAARLERYASDCDHSDDAETDEAGTFVPRVISGDFYDDLMEAARLIRRKRTPKAREALTATAEQHGGSEA